MNTTFQKHGLVGRLGITAVQILPALALCGGLFSGCAYSIPPLGRDLPATVDQTRVEFDARVRNRYPVGSDEQPLVAELRKERFKLAEDLGKPNADRLSAVYESNGLACRLRWAVYWAADQGKITAISGEYSQVCL